MKDERIALIVLSEEGLSVGEKIAERLGSVDFYFFSHHTKEFSMRLQGISFIPFDSLSGLLKKQFNNYSSFVFVMAVGIVVRVIAPFIEDKRTDPAVVVIDETGRFVISLLSGHLGGANALCSELSQAIPDSTPVITTASDIQGKPSLDLVLNDLGFILEKPHLLPNFSHLLINEKELFIYDETEKLRQYLFGQKGVCFVNGNEWEKLPDPAYPERRYICVTHKTDRDNLFRENVLLVRPKNIIIGIGCRRGVPSAEVEESILDFLKTTRWAVQSVKSIATIDIKKEEQGINDFGKKYHIPLQYFSKNEINQCQEEFSVSKKVYRLIGVNGVCEPVVLLSGAKALVIRKIKAKRVTLAAGLLPSSLLG